MDSERQSPMELAGGIQAGDKPVSQKIIILEAGAKETEHDWRVVSVGDNGAIEVVNKKGERKQVAGENILEVGARLRDRTIKLGDQGWIIKECLVAGGVMVGSETPGEQPTKIISWTELIQNNPELVGEIREFLGIDEATETPEQ